MMALTTSVDIGRPGIASGVCCPHTFHVSRQLPPDIASGATGQAALKQAVSRSIPGRDIRTRRIVYVLGREGLSFKHGRAAT
jgi:hypothetical protein